MPIVDAQVHIWSGGKPKNPNHRQVDSFSKDELLKEMAPTSRACRARGVSA
jgi:predicted TIM-barrel fold metal-dependent hydrolase